MTRPPFVRLSTYYFAYYAFMGIFMPYFALYLKAHGFAGAEIGVLIAVMQWMRLLAPNLWGWLADRLGRRMPVLRMAAFASLLGFAGVVFNDSFSGIALALALMGFFWTAQSPLAEATTFAHLAGRPGYGIVRAWGSLGFVATVLGMGAWLEHFSINSVAWGGLLVLAAICLTSLWVPEAPLVRRQSSSAGLWAIVRQRKVLALLAASMLMTGAHGAFNVFFSIHLVQAGYGKTAVGLLWTLGVMAEIIVFWCAPRLMQRFAPRSLMLLALVAAVVRFTVAGFWIEYLPVALITQTLHGLTFGAMHISAVSTVSRWFGDAHQAQGQAFYGSLAYGAGGIIGALASGALWDSVGGAWTFACGSLFALAGLLVLALGWRKADNGDPVQ